MTPNDQVANPRGILKPPSYGARPLTLRWALLFIAMALLFRAVFLAWTAFRNGSIDANAFASLDAREYFQISRNLVTNGTFSQSTSWPFAPDTWRTPGYPLFLAAIMATVGPSSVAIIIVQQVLAVFNALLVFVIARRHMSDRRAAVAAALFLVAPYGLIYSVWLLSTTLFTTAVLTCWWLWQRWCRGPNTWTVALMGVACGVLVLVRPVGLLVPLIVLLGVIGGSLHVSNDRASLFAKAGRSAKMAFVFLLCFGLTIAPWIARNARQAGALAMSHQSGIVLAYFKATEVELWRAGRAADRYLETSLNEAALDSPHEIWESIDRRLQARFDHFSENLRSELNWKQLAQGNKTSIDSFAISRELASIGLDMLRQHPGSTLACCTARIGEILTFPFVLAVRPPNGMEVNRLHQVAKALPYVCVCLGVVISLVRRRWSFQRAYFPMACVAALLVATTPQLDPRFRVPMIPLLIVVALLPRRCRAASEA